MLSTEKLVYIWGENVYGELGLDDRLERQQPTLVATLTGKSIAHVAAGCLHRLNRAFITYKCTGNHFSVFLSDNGIVMTCGKRDLCGQHNPTSSALVANADASTSLESSLSQPQTDFLRPKLIDSLLSVDIVNM